jgi:signal transduction histidine kinase
LPADQEAGHVKAYSITRRLVATVLLMELVLVGCATGASLLYERHQHLRAFDVMLRGRADSVMGAVQDEEDKADNAVLASSTLDLPSGDLYEVREETGKLLGRSGNWQGPEASGVNSSKSNWKLALRHRDYRGVTIHAVRAIDIDEPGGGFQHRIVVYYASPEQSVHEALRDAAKFLLIANSLLLLGTGIAVMLLLRHAMEPLKVLAAQAAGVSPDSWSFCAPEDAYAVKELAPLAAALNAALKRLELSFLQQRNFISDAAHELKTAITIVKSSLQLLSYKDRSVKEYKRGLDVCLADCGRMEELVQKMLALAHAEQLTAPSLGEVGFRTELAGCVREIATQLEPLAALRQVRISATIPETLAVAVPEEDCATVAKNLILNAIQHSHAGSEVLVSAQTQSLAMVRFTVQDSGEGIAPEHLPYIFDRFYRGDPSRWRETGGTGLGLAISKAILEAYGASIRVESEPGTGTTVQVLLPA